MSKELEALLEEIKLVANRHYISSCDNQITKLNCLQVEYEIYKLVGKIEILLKTTPTADEVCKALSDYFGFDYYYQDGYFYRSDGIKYIYPIKVSGFIEIQMYDGHLPPHLITLIGRFYEAQE